MDVIVLDGASALVAGEVGNAGRDETGGLLLGWRRTDLELVVVAEATGPGRHAKKSPYGLVLDVLDLQAAVDEAWARSGGGVTYLGDWHLHHEHDPQPSGIDRRSAAEIAASPMIGVPDPLLVIVGEPPDGFWRAWHGADMEPAHLHLVG